MSIKIDENLSIIEINEALELVGGEQDLLNELLQSFIDDKKLDLSQLKLLEEKNKLEAASYVHYFKGAGRQLMMKRLALAGQMLEDVLREKSEGNLSELNDLFFEEYNTALNEAKKITSQN